MKLTEDIRPITYMKTQPTELLKQVAETRRPVVITQHGVPSAVVLDVESYEEMRRTLALLKVLHHSERSAVEGGETPLRDGIEQVRRRLKAKPQR